MVRRFQAVGTQWGYSGDTEGKAQSMSTHCLQGPGVGGQRRARSGWRGRHGSARAGPVMRRQCPGFIQGLWGLGWEPLPHSHLHLFTQTAHPCLHISLGGAGAPCKAQPRPCHSSWSPLPFPPLTPEGLCRHLALARSRHLPDLWVCVAP